MCSIVAFVGVKFIFSLNVTQKHDHRSVKIVWGSNVKAYGRSSLLKERDVTCCNCDFVYGPTVLQLELNSDPPKSGSGWIIGVRYPNPVSSRKSYPWHIYDFTILFHKTSFSCSMSTRCFNQLQTSSQWRMMASMLLMHSWCPSSPVEWTPTQGWSWSAVVLSSDNNEPSWNGLYLLPNPAVSHLSRQSWSLTHGYFIVNRFLDIVIVIYCNLVICIAPYYGKQHC